MKSKSMMLLAVAVACGLVAMIGVQKLISGNKPQAEPTGKVLTAIKDIEAGEGFTKENMAFKEMPLKLIPEGAVTDPQQIVGQVIRVKTFANEIIMLAKLGDEGRLGASRDIPEGMRMYTIPVDLTDVHSGMLGPGDHVDVIATFRGRSGRNKNNSRGMILLQNIDVFATDNIRSNSNTDDSQEIKAKNVSLLVTAEQEMRCRVAKTAGGVLSLSLRNPNDTTVLDMGQIDEGIFDDAAQMGAKDAQEKNAQLEDENEKLTGDVRSFLNDQNQNVSTHTAQPQPGQFGPQAVVPEPETPKWTVTIYSGETAEAVEFDLPPEEETTDSAEKTDDQPSWKSWVKKAVGGA